MREIALSLAKLGVRRVKKADALSVRRREQVRRALAEAGEALGWPRVAALRDDSVDVAARDVRKILRRGVRSLKRKASRQLRTAKDPVRGFATRSETLEIGDAEEAKKAAEKMERSLPRWAKHREHMIENLRRRRQSLDEASRQLGDVVESWRGLFQEVLVIMT